MEKSNPLPRRLAETPPEPAPAPAADQALVGRQIRELRRSRGMTLSQLSELTGRSVGSISEMERGLSSITIKALNDIASSLGVSMNWFFSGAAIAPPEERDVVVRHGNRRRLHLAGAGTIEELLSPSLDAQIELILTTFSPGSGTGEAGRTRRGEEAGLVLSGVLKLRTDGRTYVLEAGDSFALKGGGTHWCCNPGPHETVVVWAITPACY